MLVNLNEMFSSLSDQVAAIAAINTPTLEMIKGSIEAAEELQLPIILQYTEGHSKFMAMDEFFYLAKFYGEKSKSPVCIHLDHGASFEACKEAIDMGFNSVMYDGSLKPFDENVKITKQVVEYAQKLNVSVEAELGFMLNSEVGAGEGVLESDKSYAYTDPDQAKIFVEKTNVDCLAIAAGTVHGLYFKKPNLNFDVMLEIYEKIKKPIVIHGGSGLKPLQYEKMIANGVRKINYYTYMNQIAAESIRDNIKSSGSEYVFFDELSYLAKNTIKNDIKRFISLLSKGEVLKE